MQAKPIHEFDDAQAWETLALKFPTATFWHTAWIQNYMLHYRPEQNIENISFAVYDGQGKCVALVPLFIEDHPKEQKQFCKADQFIPAPALNASMTFQQAETTLKWIHGVLDEIAQERQVKLAQFYIDPLSNPQSLYKAYNYNYFLKYGFIDCSLMTQIIDLRVEEQTLWKEIRKGHKYNIRQGQKNYTVEIYDHTNIQRSDFDEYQQLHHKAAGRITRPLKTFDLDFEMISKGYAILALAKKDGTTVGATRVTTFNGCANYGSAAQAPGLSVPASHTIQWEVIQYLQKKAFQFYELGIQQYGELPYNTPSQKELDISFFKRGFGGYTQPLFQAQKTYI